MFIEAEITKSETYHERNLVSSVFVIFPNQLLIPTIPSKPLFFSINQFRLIGTNALQLCEDVTVWQDSAGED